MNAFRLTIIIIALVLAIIAALIFAGILPGFRAPRVGQVGAVTLWGVIPASPELKIFFNDFNEKHRKEVQITYLAKSPATIEGELLDALARGEGPDLVLLPHPLILKQADKLYHLPYQSIPLANYQASYLSEGALFLRPDGILALPFYIDPLVLYYNETLLANGGIAAPPSSWAAIADPAATAFLKNTAQVDTKGNIAQAAIALGQFNNVAYAKDILSLLIFQTGEEIIRAGEGGRLEADLGTGAARALQFFSQFSNPAFEQYTWNSALPNSRDFFTANNLALYLGRASDLESLRERNPHLSFNVTLPPQPEPAVARLTVGTLYGLAITKQTKKLGAAFLATTILSGPPFAKTISELAALPPARRDLLAAGHPDPFMAIFYKAAIMSRGWLDAWPEETTALFKNAIESVVSGRLNYENAINNFRANLERLLRTI